MSFEVSKSYGHERGLSCTFRQWRANSHCRLLHGYALRVTIVVGSESLDQRNWVHDYGAFKPVERWLRTFFDHTTLIAADDPQLGTFYELNERKLIDLRVMAAVGCEAFARFIAEGAPFGFPKGVFLKSVTVAEHGSNAATYYAQVKHA